MSKCKWNETLERGLYFYPTCYFWTWWKRFTIKRKEAMVLWCSIPKICPYCHKEVKIDERFLRK